MNIILAAINAKYIHSNLAVYSLRAFAGDYTPEIQIAEYTINQQTESILKDLFLRKPDVLCLSCYIWNLSYVETVVREVRKLFPELPIWLGGPEVSYDSKEVLERLPEVTGVMMGEGEQTFTELMDYYHGKEISLADIKGITYRLPGGGTAVNVWREVMDLSMVPFVYSDMKDFKNKIIYYESSRGCPFSCSYCLSSVDKCLRFREVSLVKKELQFFLDHEVPQVKFVDRTFNCNHKHAMEIWEYILEHDKGITNFHFEVASDLLNEEELQLIERMRPGLIQLEIGVQSTNLRTLQEIRRTMKFDEVRRIVERINSYRNIHQHLDLIAGLPYEDLESFGRSYNDVYTLCPEQLQLGFLKVLKGSYMEEQKEQYGLVYQSAPPYEVLYTNWLSYKDLLELKQIEEMTEVYYNSGQFSYTMRQLVKEFASPYELYRLLGDYYHEHGYDAVNHTRIARYDILLAFMGAHVPEYRLFFYKELLILDLYLRENVKSRPAFAGEPDLDTNSVRLFYEKESAERTCLEGYGEYDKRQLWKMTHIESFSHAVLDGGREEPCMLLFDYRNRNPLNHDAKVIDITNKMNEKKV